MEKKEFETNHIKYGWAYPDGSGNRMSLEIDTKEEKNFQCKIKNSDIMCSIEELEWLGDAILNALSQVKKLKKGVKPNSSQG